MPVFGESKPKEVNKAHLPSEQATKPLTSGGGMPNKNHPGTARGWPSGTNVKKGRYQE